MGHDLTPMGDAIANIMTLLIFAAPFFAYLASFDFEEGSK